LGFGVPGFRVEVSGFRVAGIGSRVQKTPLDPVQFRVQGSQLRVEG